ncbi:pentapeptide repeat-containing protein [Parasphingorhabdus sp.]|uniref:pentapeptide repeat-containing protein n=1 Tax=Parasphingorhabdus sp. TaxID=2709688 RepID=UPI003C73477D
MARNIVIFIAGLTIMTWLSPAVRAASDEVPPSCLAAFGDVWGEAEAAVSKQYIDGSMLKTPADFMRETHALRRGLKIIKGGDFSGWDFSQIPLGNVCFYESELTGSSFSGATSSGIGFINSNLSESNLSHVRMPKILLRNANLTNVAAQNADFSGGHFDGGWFEGSVEGWNIDGADMTGFVFDCGITVPDGCPVYQGGAAISAKGTDFTRATLHSFRLHNIILSGAILDQTIVGPAQLPDLAKAAFRGDIVLRGGGSDVRLTADEAQKLIAENTRQRAVEANPSFDCAKAATKVELEICGEYASDLRSADRDIAALYQRAKGVDSGVKASQRAWLKQRNLCGKVEYPADCIRESYSLRKGQLLGLSGERQWLARGEAALFIDDLLPLPASSIGPELFAKITPALVGASMTEILIGRGQDGLYAIKGSAVGANAHLCSIDASQLHFDQASGWYVPVSEGAAIPIFRILDDRLEIFASGRPDYEKYPEASDFMGCGMRASLGETVRINVSDELMESYRKSLNEEM